MTYELAHRPRTESSAESRHRRRPLELGGRRAAPPGDPGRARHPLRPTPRLDVQPDAPR
ncbi:hypothetical protein [Clavibacter tessellarius]|uniref:hypothetical protein n=1 Tax=Clavibacter tessellarius TaxID=31965 RepID=UPI0032486B61